MTPVERDLALRYAPREARTGIAALFALDDVLAGILRTTREPVVGQMRLTWWYEALGRLDVYPPPAEPVLHALATHVLRHGVSAARLAAMIDAWEPLLDPEIGDAPLIAAHAARGAILFTAAGLVAGAASSDPLETAGQGWALADLARHVRSPVTAAAALATARPLLESATRHRWSRAGRSLGALAHLAAMDLAVPLDRPIPHGAPHRIGRLLWHRLSGR